MHLSWIVVCIIYSLLHHISCQDINITTTSTSTTEYVSTTQFFTTDIGTLNPTNEPTTEPTLPTMEPTFSPVSTSTTGTSTSTSSVILEQGYEVTITIDLTLSIPDGEEFDDTAKEELKSIIRAYVAEEYPALTNIQIVIITDANANAAATEQSIRFEIIGNVESEQEAENIKENVASEEFANNLDEEIEAETNYEVTNVSAEAVVVQIEEEEQVKVSWLDPSTYVLLNWILVGAAGCILLAIMLVLIRCCCMCCNRDKKDPKSKYQVGGPLFDARGGSGPDTRSKRKRKQSKERETAFHNDLVSAIEMNAQKKYLKKVRSKEDDALDQLGDDMDAVAAAFDMDFDNIQTAQSEQKEEEEVKETDGLMPEGRDATRKQSDRKSSEGGMMSTGPKQKANDSKEKTPPPPEPPMDVTKMDDYDLL